MKKINVGLIGCGTVGGGVVETLQKRHRFIKDYSGLDINIKKACDKRSGVLKKIRLEKSRLTRDPDDILGDKNIDIVIELIGGVTAAKDIILRAIRAKKHVVTANKALLAVCGRRIFGLAGKNKVMVRFEASVGGGIPIIKSLREGFIANRIGKIYGIINGTSNFILTKMEKSGYDFTAALKEAQKMGVAEKNPGLDINGVDTAHKLAILALIGFKFPMAFGDIYVEGIEDIEAGDIQYAGEMGYAIKLLAIAKRAGRELEARVHPTLLAKEHMLSNVDGIFNAIYVTGDNTGGSLFYGEGAGKFPTASSVIADIVDIGKVVKTGTEAEDFIFVRNSGNEITGIKEFGNIKTRYYIRFSAIDKPGVLAQISGILARHNISIASVTQKERREAHVVPIVMMTHEAIELDMQKAIKKIDNLDTIRQKSVRIRVESA